MQHKFRESVITTLPLIVFLALWQAITGDRGRLQFLFSSPVQIFRKAVSEYTGGSVWHDLFVTGTETVLGLLCGSAIGILTGLLMWGNGRFGRIARPYVIVLGSIPVFAIAPMLIIWFGIGLLSKVVMAAFGVALIAIVQSYEGAQHAAGQHLFFARSLGAGQDDIVRKIIVPGSLRWVMTGIKINIGMAMLGAFIGEFVNSDAGLGHYILRAGSLYDMAGVIFGIFNLSLLALSLNGLAALAERIWFPWTVKQG